MADEIQISQEQWEAALAKQIAKQQAKTPTRATIVATKPAREKSFVAFHFFAQGQSDALSLYGARSPETYAFVNFYTRPGDTFAAVVSDAKNYKTMFPNGVVVCHDHAWNEPCKPAPKLNKCKEI